MINHWTRNVLAAGIIGLSSLAAQAETGSVAGQLQGSWDRANFGLSGDEQKDAMLELVKECVDLTPANESDAEVLIWCGIANSSYAGMASAFSAMKYARAARALLEQAIEVDASALSGAAQTSLGTLYFKVPGWPIGFGDKDKAKELLQSGLEADPEGMDSNFFYADFLLETDQPAEAARYLEKALAAPARPERALADSGRTNEINAMLAAIGQAE